MRTYSVPAAYRRHIESSIALAMAEVGADVKYREDEDPRVRRLAPVPDAMLEPRETGRLLIVVMDAAADPALHSIDVSEPLYAIAAASLS